MTKPLRRFFAGAFGATLLCAGLAPYPAATIQVPVRCGLTTLQGTIAFKDGTLSCAKGDDIVLRDDLREAGAGRLPTALVSFAAMADLHIADEESPLRGEFTDKCGDVPTKAAFRFQEALEPQLINSVLRAVDQLGAGPMTGRPLDFGVSLGDPTDNQQWNELRNFISLLDGGTIVDPDSGKRGYEGVQGRDPYPSPVKGESLRALANEPFYAVGLRRPGGAPIPWYSVMGNHDRKVRGTVPNDLLAPGIAGPWMTFARAWVTGSLRINDLAPDQQQRVCANPALLTDPAFWTEVAATPGSASLITADPNRRLVSPEQWLAEHLPPAQAKAIDPSAVGSTGLPAGHGLAAHCTSADGTSLDRNCYSFDVPPAAPGEPPVHFVALDSSADEGIDTGNIDRAEWEWLNADLKTHSKCYYATASARACTKTGKQNSVIVVLSHHSESTMTNDTPRLDGGTTYQGTNLEDLLLRFPNVVAHVDAHTHWNKVTPHTQPVPRPGGYWEINIASIVDWPNQARAIEIADNHDGTLSIFSVGIDAAAPVDPHAMTWVDDATPETVLGSVASPSAGAPTRNVNEEMLASIARWTAANDPQTGAAWVASQITVNANTDRNVELVLTHPAGTIPLPVPRIVLPGPTGTPRPPFPFPFPFPFPRQQFPTILPPSGSGSQSQSPPPFGLPYARRTLKGLGSPAPDKGMPLRYPIATGVGFLGGGWLFVVRVRRRMVGV